MKDLESTKQCTSCGNIIYINEAHDCNTYGVKTDFACEFITVSSKVEDTVQNNDKNA